LWKNWKNILENENFEKKFGFNYSEVKRNYRLSRLNSIEHIHSQSRVNEDEKWVDWIDKFGNLALISNHMNSKLWGKKFINKRTIIQEQLNNGTIESLKMLLVYSKYDEWNPENCEKHHNEMIKILIEDLENTNSKNLSDTERKNS